MSDLRYVGLQLRFVVPGPPVAWARAGQRGRMKYTPPKQKRQMEALKWAALSAMGSADRKRWWERAVEVEVVAYFKPSRSWPRWKRDAALLGTYAHTKKPDSDNVVKLVKDALSGVVYRDDASVVDQIGRKRFADVERTHVVVRPLFVLGDDDG